MSSVDKIENGKTIVLFGKSGTGKSTIEKMLITEGYKKAKSLTTRTPRDGEIDGVDYYFTNKERLAKLVANGDIVEVANYLGQTYALTRGECGPNTVVVVELDGLRQLKENEDLSIYAVYLKADIDVLEKRMIERGDTVDKVQERLEKDVKLFVGAETKADLILDVNELSPEEITEIIIKNILQQ